MNNYGYGAQSQEPGNVVVVPQSHPPHFAALASAAHRAVETTADATADGGGVGADMSHQVSNVSPNQHLLQLSSGGNYGRAPEQIYGCNQCKFPTGCTVERFHDFIQLHTLSPSSPVGKQPLLQIDSHPYGATRTSDVSPVHHVTTSTPPPDDHHQMLTSTPLSSSENGANIPVHHTATPQYVSNTY